jgi:hypothetical protein
MAQSALSQIVRRIEEWLGLRLLSRTTRSVAPTDAGERLLATLGPMLHDLDAAIASLRELRDRPSGTIRITTVEHAAKTILLPATKRLLIDNPDITIEITIDYGWWMSWLIGSMPASALAGNCQGHDCDAHWSRYPDGDRRRTALLPQTDRSCVTGATDRSSCDQSAASDLRHTE